MNSNFKSELDFEECPDVRTKLPYTENAKATDDYKNLIASLNDNYNVIHNTIPEMFGPSFRERLHFEESIFSFPNRLPELETSSLAADIIRDEDEDITLRDDFSSQPYVLPTFSIHEQVEKMYFD